MISNLPAEAIDKALEHQHHMLEDDLKYNRPIASDEAFSILCFIQFVRMQKRGEVIPCARRLPPDHLDFYRETIARLVHGQALPVSAMEQFERAFPLNL